MAGTIKHEWNGTILTITSDSGTSSADLQGAKGATGARGARGLTGRTGGGALIEDGVIRDDTTWSSAGIMDRFAEQIGTEGNPVVINEPLPNFPYSITATFDTKQEGTGEPYPAGGGKQLFDINNRTSTHTNMSITDDDWVTVTMDNTSGTAMTYTSLYTPPSDKIVAGKQYVVVTEVKKLTAGYIITVGNTTATNKSQFVENVSATKTGTLVSIITARSDFSDCLTMLRTNVCCPAGESLETTYRISVLEDTTITADNFSYMPYENIRPIEGYDSISITRSGKNLFNLPSINTGNYTITATIDSDGWLVLNGTASITSFIRIDTALPAGTYTISLNNPVAEKNIAIRSYAKGNSALYEFNNTARTANFTITKTVINPITYFNIRIEAGTTLTNFKLKPQLEAGSTATAYEPYKSDTYTISLGNKYCQGVLDVNRGELVVDKACIVFDGTESINLQNNYNNTGTNRFSYTNTPIPNNQGEMGICSHMTYGFSPLGDNNINNRIGCWKNGGLYWRFDSCKTAEEMKAYMAEQYNAGKPVQVVYELVEPQVIKINPEEIKAISGNNTLYSNADNLYVFGRIDTMKQLQALMERVSALEAKVGG